MKIITRRRFIKDTAIAGTAIAAVPTLLIRKAPAAWTPGTNVHPNVDNLKVVGIIDSAMTRGTETEIPWARQEELVVKERAWEANRVLACKKIYECECLMIISNIYMDLCHTETV